MIDAFIEQELATGQIRFDWKKSTTPDEPVQFTVHSHCHQKTLDGGRWTFKLLQRIPSAVVNDTNAGCCGMTGSFGYELEHAKISKIIAGQRLLLNLNRALPETMVISNGFSCRHQIKELSNRRPIHVVEALRCFLPRMTISNTSIHVGRAS